MEDRPKKKTGRPLTQIDEAEVEKLVAYGASNRDIADFFGVHESGICRRFSKLLAKARAERRITIRRWQTENAEQGNATIQIWLGKQELGQVDKVQTENRHEIILLRWTDDHERSPESFSASEPGPRALVNGEANGASHGQS